MSSLEQPMDARILVRWLGAEGARAGLEKSRVCTVDFLKDLATSLGIDVPSKPKRQELIDEIVRIAAKRIDKSLEELYQMQSDELVEYFERLQVESHELLDLLKQLQLHPGKEGRRNLIELVARELAETGRFMRIASQGNSRSD
jgi:hypothetical protein